MKKRTAGIIKTVIIGVICVGIVAGFYYYLTNRAPRSVETTGETDEITSVLSKNLEKDYPASPRAVTNIIIGFCSAFIMKLMMMSSTRSCWRRCVH